LKFSNLSYNERVDSVNQRLNKPIGRITSIDELLKLTNNSLYIVLSPMTNDGNVSNTLIINWELGKIEDEFGNIITKFNNDEQITYFIYHLDSKHNHKALECKDLNIMPNNYNNHAVFNKIGDAKSYAVQRKMTYTLSHNLDDLDILSNEDVRVWITRDEIQKYHELD